MVSQTFLIKRCLMTIILQKILVQRKFYIKFALSFEILAYGVTGNTFVFGAKEYRFETYWANFNLTLIMKIVRVFYWN